MFGVARSAVGLLGSAVNLLTFQLRWSDQLGKGFENIGNGFGAIAIGTKKLLRDAVGIVIDPLRAIGHKLGGNDLSEVPGDIFSNSAVHPSGGPSVLDSALDTALRTTAHDRRHRHHHPHTDLEGLADGLGNAASTAAGGIVVAATETAGLARDAAEVAARAGETAIGAIADAAPGLISGAANGIASVAPQAASAVVDVLSRAPANVVRVVEVVEGVDCGSCFRLVSGVAQGAADLASTIASR